MDWFTPFDDWRENLVIVLMVAGVFVFFSGLDSQLVFLLSSPRDYLVSNDFDLEFKESQVDLLNAVNDRSLGVDAVASERLYCGRVRDGDVFDFRLADVIVESSLTGVRGACEGEVDLWLHTQPSGVGELSREDRDLEGRPEFTCIQFEEVVVSPVSGVLDGVNCWRVVYGSGDPGFVMVSVGLDG